MNPRSEHAHSSGVLASRIRENTDATDQGSMASHAARPDKDEPGAMLPRGQGCVLDGLSDTVSDHHAHEGSFASGQAISEMHPERFEERGDFAEGQEQQKHTDHGNFAEGQLSADPNPELLGHRGDFAAGQRRRIRTRS
jgi:hypothetical protein